MDSAIRLRMEKPLVERVDGLRQTFLFLRILVVPYVCSGNRSRKLPRRGKQHRVAKRVGRHCTHRLCHCEDAGCFLETAGSIGNLERQGTVGHVSGEIYAIRSLSESDIQQTPILEAKHACAG
jgi:hypothetical protein